MYRLYKLDSKKKLRILNIWTEKSEIIQESGLIDGKLSIRRSQCIGKNLDKANFTTPETQAILEAEAKYVKKLKEGYFKTIKEAENEIVILPTLAHEYNKHSKKVVFPCYVQPKLDGMRCLGNQNEMKSRQNTSIETMDHIQAELGGIEKFLDGELYSHGLSFQENMKLIKKKRFNSSDVKYHVYDMILDGPFILRYKRLKELVAEMENVEIVPTYIINNKDELKDLHAQFLNEGYEGTIIRWGKEGYPINKRSQYLLKYKDFIDIDAEIINIIPSEKIPTHGSPILKYNDKTFGAGLKMSHEERIDLLKNKDKYIGKKANIRFFEWTDDNIPRFPVMIGVHEDR